MKGLWFGFPWPPSCLLQHTIKHCEELGDLEKHRQQPVCLIAASTLLLLI